MPEGYNSHTDYMSWVTDDADARMKLIDEALRKAFVTFIETRQVDVIIFSQIDIHELSTAIMDYPSVLKPLASACNIAGRAIERDLGIKNIDTYNPKLTREKAAAIAGYIKPFLPAYLEIPALLNLDKVSYIDKEIRKTKGQWEHAVRDSLNRFGRVKFKKRKFTVGQEGFELDAASPLKGDIKIGVDVKRIEARKDIHKRSDEIVNKGTKLKSVFPDAKFAAIIYYPFIDEHVNVKSRLSSENVDEVFFASHLKDSVENAAKMLLKRLGIGQ